MSERLELPDGQWAELRDPGDIPENKRKPVKKLMMRMRAETLAQQPLMEASPQPTPGAGMFDVPPKPAAPELDVTPEVFELMDEMTEMAAVALVSAWSYDVNIDIEGLQSLPGKCYDVIYQKGQESLGQMFPNFSPTEDEASPTGP